VTFWVSLGWAGNACFFSRSIVQWAVAERTRSSRAPRLFWLLSLAGSALMGVYAVHRGQAVLFAGFATNGVIYLRNLRILLRPRAAQTLPLRAVALFAAAALSVLLAASVSDSTRSMATGWIWIACATAGQAIWSSRFVLQWWYSERSGESHFPVAFWSVSLAGNLLLLAYALHLSDAVLTAGLLAGPVMQIRNLMLLHSATAEDAAAPSASLAAR
jgi:lipid-A-disaccharide synthase-like uncharacterized protein